MLNQVFISYRHESQEHARDVRRLGELLREAGIPVAMDQFHQDQHPGGPDQGWPKWCEDCATKSACVLIVGSKGWFAAYDKEEAPGTGLGAAAEADLIRQDLWDTKGNSARIRLAFLHDLSPHSVPKRLRSWEPFRPFSSDDQLNQLVRWIAGCLGLQGIKPPTVRWPTPVHFQPDLANRNQREWPAVVALLSGRAPHRILLIEGGSGLGKSALIRQAAAYAKQLEIPLAWVDFKGGGLDVAAVLGQIDLDLGANLPEFAREGASKSHLLRKDLRKLRRPILIILDSFEDAAGNQPVADWISQQLLTEVETSCGLAVIVAGQKVPDLARAGWRDLAQRLPLEPITDLTHWQEWATRRFPGFQVSGTGCDLLTVLRGAKGVPAIVAQFCEVLARG